MMNPRHMAIYFVGILAALIANSYALHVNLVRLDEHERLVIHTHEVLEELTRVEGKVRGVEAAARGAMLAPSEEHFWREYREITTRLYATLDRVGELLVDNPQQLARLADLRSFINQRQERLKVNLDHVTNKKHAADKTLAELVVIGKESTEKVKELVTRMANAERKLLEERRHSALESERVVSITFWAALFVNILLASLAFWLFRRQVVAQNAALEKQEYISWIQNGVGEFSRMQIGLSNPQALAEKALVYITKRVGLPAGAFYIMQEGSLKLAASIAGPVKSKARDEYEIGEGLVGGAFKREELHEITEVPENYFKVESSLGEAVPRNLCFIPLRFQGLPLGVVELGGFRRLEKRELELLAELQERLSITLNAAIASERQAQLLEETQRQSEELQTQQEELRTNNEELEEQTTALLRAQERQQAQQEELRQINEELESQARALEQNQEAMVLRGEELEIAKRQAEDRTRELERTNQYKSEFLAKMSHELRTPLNSMLILSTLLGENKENNLSDQQLEFARTIHDAGADLLNLINDILDLAKLEARKLNLHAESFALDGLMKQVESQFKVMFEKKGVKFKISMGKGVPEVLKTDRQRVEQVLRNFLSNAIKFTDKGEVELSVQLSKTKTGNISFIVKDTGIGIPRSKLQKIFEAFEQVDSSTSRSYGGTGLGLTISRELAALLKGRIEVESEEGKGSTFTLSIPAEIDSTKVAEEKPVEVASPSSRGSQQLTVKPAMIMKNTDGSPSQPVASLLSRVEDMETTRSILIVEDDDGFRRALEESSRAHGFTPLSVSDGETALELLDHHTPSAILLDIKLPGVSGLAVLENIKQKSRLRHVPIHMISALDQQIPALRMGAVGYLGKPVTMDGVRGAFEKIEKMLDKRVKRVLIIEDDERQRMSMEELLRGPGVEITSAKNAKDALSLLSETEVDCIVADLTLPDVSGVALLEKIHEALKDEVPPIIIYTGRDLDRSEEEKLRQFSESIIIKGAKSPDRLLDEVSLFLHRVESELPEEKRSMLTELRMREKAFEGRTVLLVDDDLRNVFALTSALESKGLKVLAARNGIEALETLKKSPKVDAVLMDIMMPKMDGFQATRKIREMAEFANLPIIALTAKAMKSDRDEALNAGANDYLPKPVNLMNLISVLKVWLAGKRMWM